MPRRSRVPAYIEAGRKRVFACTVDWPGWCRSAKNAAAALQALTDYAPRYARVAARAGLELPGSFELVCTEHFRGTTTTDFGAPDVVRPADSDALAKPDRARLIALMQAAWAAFDDIAARSPAALRKGPRGGGRDRDRMIEHVLGAEQAYARKIGVRHAQPAFSDAAAIGSLRTAISDACSAADAATPWPVRYFVRRLAWHALDHAWEMEDRTPAA
jgi:hypothetical protein